jgi:hypothetical protein
MSSAKLHPLASLARSIITYRYASSRRYGHTIVASISLDRDYCAANGCDPPNYTGPGLHTRGLGPPRRAAGQGKLYACTPPLTELATQSHPYETYSTPSTMLTPPALDCGSA